MDFSEIAPLVDHDPKSISMIEDEVASVESKIDDLNYELGELSVELEKALEAKRMIKDESSRSKSELLQSFCEWLRPQSSWPVIRAIELLLSNESLEEVSVSTMGIIKIEFQKYTLKLS